MVLSLLFFSHHAWGFSKDSLIPVVLSSPGQGNSGDGVQAGSALGPELSWHISGWEDSEDMIQMV